MDKHSHNHCHCAHDVAYCSICDACYCTKCGKEWGKYKNWWTYTNVYPTTSVWETQTISSSDIKVSCNHSTA